MIGALPLPSAGDGDTQPLVRRSVLVIFSNCASNSSVGIERARDLGRDIGRDVS